MKYTDSTSNLDTPKKILKVNHAGEFGAINIYSAQIRVCKIVNPKLVTMLEGFLADEQNHPDTGLNHGGKSVLYASVRSMISLFTEGIIRFGMR